MKVNITYDADNNKPIICLEPETEDENLQLEVVASFDTACFRLILEEKVAS